MSDEKKPAPEAAEAAKKAPEETKAEAAATPAIAKPTSASSPWLPVLVVIIILPILSFVMTDAVMIPRVKKALGDIAALKEEAAHPSEGGVQPAPNAKKKEAAKKEGAKKEGAKKEGGHGEGAAAEESGIKFENIVANLTGSMKSRFVKVSFVIEGDDEEFAEVVNSSKVKIIDSAIGILAALTVAELEEPGMKNIVRSDLIAGFNQALKGQYVDRLYFSEFVIQ